jgi:hypothetical protein
LLFLNKFGYQFLDVSDSSELKNGCLF